MLLTLSGESVIKIQYSSFPLFPVAYPFRIATYYIQYYVKGKKFKVNEVIFPSDCEARAINLEHKNRYFNRCYQCKIEKYFHRYFSISYGKHEINMYSYCKHQSNIYTEQKKKLTLCLSADIHKYEIRIKLDLFVLKE